MFVIKKIDNTTAMMCANKSVTLSGRLFFFASSIPAITYGSYQDGLPLFSASIDLIRGDYEIDYQILTTEI